MSDDDAAAATMAAGLRSTKGSVRDEDGTAAVAAAGKKNRHHR